MKTNGVDSSLERDTIIYFVGKVVAGAAGIATLMLLTRALGIESYGQLSLWLVTATWISQATSGWLRQSILRFDAELHRCERGCDYRRTTAGLEAASVAAAIALVAVGAWATDHLPVRELSMPGRLAAIALAAALTSWGVRLSYLQASLRSRAAVATDALRASLPLGLIAIAHFAGWLTVSRALLLIASATAIAIVGAVRMDAPAVSVRGRFSWPLARQLGRFGLPMSVWFLLASGHVFVGRLALEGSVSDQDIGLYSAIQDVVSRGLGLLFMPMTLALHTHVMSLWATRSFEDVQRAIRKSYLYMLMAGGLCAVVVVALGPWLPALLFDEAPVDVGDAVALTLILCASSLATQAGLIAHKGLELRERTRTMVHLMLVSLVVNAAISWTTVSSLGMYGPAWGILGGSLCYLALAGRYRPQ